MKAEETKDTFKIDDKVLWVGGGILLAGAIIAGIIIYKKKKKLIAKDVGKGSLGGLSFCKYGDSYPLKIGSCGENVTALQKKLVALRINIGDHGAKGDGVDGKYGKDTEKAVKKAIGRSTFELTDFEKLKTTTMVV